MAQRDYVRKKKGTSKKNSSRVIPNLMMAIGIILVLLFVAILYMVSKNKPDNRPVIEQQKPPIKPEVTLPEKPQERWTYLKQLENPDGDERQIPQNQQAIREREQILAGFRNDNAKPVEVRTQQNQPAQVSISSPQIAAPLVQNTPQTTSNKWFIQCGAFKDKSNAESLRAKIAMAGIESSIQSARLYRVLVGTYTNKSEAESIVSKLKENSITNCIISSK